MTNEVFEAIVKTRDIEVQHTLETRQIAFDSDVQLRKAICKLVHILVSNGSISIEEGTDVMDAMSVKKEEEK